MRLLPEILSATRFRGPAYEGFYRSTRPFGAEPGRFIHDTAIIRTEPNGLLRLGMSTGGVVVDGWMFPLQDRVFCMGS